MILKFLIFSGLAACVNILTGFVLYGLLGLDTGVEYAASVAAAFVAGMGVSFVLNRAHTFGPSGRPPQEELRDFFIVSIGGLILTTLLAQLFLSWLSGVGPMVRGLVTPPAVSHVLAVGVTAFYSFLAHKHFSFRRRDSVAAKV